jgi:hypothetical protein
VVSDDEGMLLVPLRFTELDSELHDAASPELRAAPLFVVPATSEWRQEAIGALLAFLRDAGTVSLFLRFHPLLEAYREDFAAFGAVVDHGPNYAIRLERPLDEIRADMRRSHRQGIRKFGASGYVYEREADCADLEAFQTLYALTMERVHAREAYRFSLDYFTELVASLGDEVALWVLRIDGRIAAAHLLTECCGIVQGLYAGVHPDYHGRFSQVGLYDRELEWAKSVGASEYFVGGAGTESLHQFKAGITQYRPRENSARIIVDEGEYGRRCAAWEHAHDARIGPVDEFFPPYRVA